MSFIPKLMMKSRVVMSYIIDPVRTQIINKTHSSFIPLLTMIFRIKYLKSRKACFKIRILVKPLLTQENIRTHRKLPILIRAPIMLHLKFNIKKRKQRERNLNKRLKGYRNMNDASRKNTKS